ncbi:MAG: AAA family ATPase [Patescibacteria group bacterium]
MLKVALLGAPGAGKDTLSCLLKVKLGKMSVGGKLVKTRQIAEFSVLWTDKTGPTKEVFEQFYIWYKQNRWDRDFDRRKEDPYTVTISAAPAPLAYFFTLAFSDTCDEKHRLLLADLYERALSGLLKFDVIFYLPTEFRVPDGDRLRKRSFRQSLDAAIRSFLLNHRIPFTELRGDEFKRADKAFRILKKKVIEQIAAKSPQ